MYLQSLLQLLPKSQVTNKVLVDHIRLKQTKLHMHNMGNKEELQNYD